LKKLKINILNLLILIFLLHGFLFFFVPEQIYDINSPIRYIKYISFLLVLFVLSNKKSLIKTLYYLFLFSFLLIINLIAVGKNFNAILFVNYIFPLTLLFFSDNLSYFLKINKVVVITYLTLTVIGYIEFFYLIGIFPRFADRGYRIVSIFVNPNNLGIMITILSVYIISAKFSLNVFLNLFVVLNSAFLIYLTGSRSSLIVFFGYFTILFIYKLIKDILNVKRMNYIKILGLFLLTLSLVTTYINYADNFFNSINSLSRSLTESDLFEGRLNQMSVFFQNISQNFIFPSRVQLLNNDNVYLHIWSFFGLPILLLFIIFNLFVLINMIKQGKNIGLRLLIILLVYGFAENFVYFWPVGYIYWFIVSNKPNLILRFN
jgi:hypothetical protein